MKIPEIVAPAGDWTNLRTAVQAGADAVYFGLKDLNMRANAKNFSIFLTKSLTQLHQQKTTQINP